MPIHIVAPDLELTISSARLKATHKMSYADAFAASLAIKKRATLTTGDKEFKILEKEIKLKFI